jgi:hypothetical protein
VRLPAWDSTRARQEPDQDYCWVKRWANKMGMKVMAMTRMADERRLKFGLLAFFVSQFVNLIFNR